MKVVQIAKALTMWDKVSRKDSPITCFGESCSECPFGLAIDFGTDVMSLCDVMDMAGQLISEVEEYTDLDLRGVEIDG